MLDWLACCGARLLLEHVLIALIVVVLRVSVVLHLITLGLELIHGVVCCKWIVWCLSMRAELPIPVVVEVSELLGRLDSVTCLELVVSRVGLLEALSEVGLERVVAAVAWQCRCVLIMLHLGHETLSVRVWLESFFLVCRNFQGLDRLLLLLWGCVTEKVWLITCVDDGSVSTENVAEVVVLRRRDWVYDRLCWWLARGEVEIEKIRHSIAFLLLFFSFVHLLACKVEVEIITTSLLFPIIFEAVSKIKVVKVIPSDCVSAVLVIGCKLLEARPEVEFLLWLGVASNPA